MINVVSFSKIIDTLIIVTGFIVECSKFIKQSFLIKASTKTAVVSAGSAHPVGALFPSQLHRINFGCSNNEEPGKGIPTLYGTRNVAPAHADERPTCQQKVLSQTDERSAK